MRDLLGGLEACLGCLACLEGLEKPNLREGSLILNCRSKSFKKPQEAPNAPKPRTETLLYIYIYIYANSLWKLARDVD